MDRFWQRASPFPASHPCTLLLILSPSCLGIRRNSRHAGNLCNHWQISVFGGPKRGGVRWKRGPVGGLSSSACQHTAPVDGNRSLRLRPPTPYHHSPLATSRLSSLTGSRDQFPAAFEASARQERPQGRLPRDGKKEKEIGQGLRPFPLWRACACIWLLHSDSLELQYCAKKDCSQTFKNLKSTRLYNLYTRRLLGFILGTSKRKTYAEDSKKQQMKT